MFAPVFFMYSSDSLCVFTCSCSCASLLPSLISSSAVNCTGSKCGSPSLQTVRQGVSLLRGHPPPFSMAPNAQCQMLYTLNNRHGAVGVEAAHWLTKRLESSLRFASSSVMLPSMMSCSIHLRI